MSPIKSLVLVVVAILTAGSLFAAENAADKAPAAAAAVPPPAPIKISTQHRLKSGGTDIAYTATAEEIYLKDSDDKYTANFFTVSYTKDGPERPGDRPLTFVFNGGPGSASLWLHLGLVGPKIIDIPSDASDLEPPHTTSGIIPGPYFVPRTWYLSIRSEPDSVKPWVKRRTRISGALMKMPIRWRNSFALLLRCTIAGIRRNSSSVRAMVASAAPCWCRDCNSN